MILAASFLSLLLCAPPARAVPRPIQPPAAEFPAQDLWLNAKGLTIKRLHGRRVALIAFINSANLNSLRALSVLKAWDERYALDGLSVIAVHTPLYGFQRDPALVSERLKRLGVTFPVILDDDRSLWNAYANEGWPAFYLVDSRGKIVYDMLGEGAYAGFEDEIRGALSDAGYDVKGDDVATDTPQEGCGAATPELALSSTLPQPLAIADFEAQDGSGDSIDRELIVSSRDGELGKRGPWRREPEGLRLLRSDPDHSSFLRVICRGVQVFGLLSGPAKGSKGRFFVRQDGLWLHSGNAGADVKFDDDGRSYVEAGEPRLYWIVKNPDDSEHAITMMPADRGDVIHAFQFADSCLPYRP